MLVYIAPVNANDRLPRHGGAKLTGLMNNSARMFRDEMFLTCTRNGW